jgi:KDO2-lipid IV(A) lauroyltransferase
MKIFIYLMSLLPFPMLHAISNGLYFVIYHVAKYRRAVVRENLARSFPDETPEWREQVEKKFYRNFCDTMLEVVKTTTISKSEFLARCKFTTPEIVRNWFEKRVNMEGISSHLANWEWMGLAICSEVPFDCYVVYKPLNNARMNQFLINSRGRFGIKLIPIKSVRTFFENDFDKPYLLGLLSDQAPHDYGRAFEVEFLNQKTYYAPGPGLLAVQYQLTPCWGWMRRVGRSRFEWGIDPVLPDTSIALTPEEISQVERVATAHSVTLAAAEQGYRIVKEYSRLLEVKIKMAPEDWLWSHRRWKSRN